MFINDWSAGKDSTIDPAYLSQQQKKEDAILINKNVITNGTYNATDDEADGYSTINVEVANTYTNEDNGKVVSENQLVAQTTREAEIVENGIYDTTLNNSITVNISAPTPTPGVKSGAIIRDYDGSIIASYTPAQFAVLSAYPAQPVHTGLTGQGYNWTLANAKAYVAKYGYVEIGATYITDDSKTKYYILIQEANTEGTISLGLNGTAVIDWGDGSEINTITGGNIDTSIDTSHTYATVGKYTITINVTNGSASLMGIQSLTLGKVEIGSGVTSIGNVAFSDCNALTSITISEGVTSIGYQAFYYCYALASITIPEGVTLIDSSAFSQCYALTSITIPEGVTSIRDSVFSYCYSLTSIIIPEGVTSIGGSMFSDCYALTSITIPEGVTLIGDSAFSYCYSLTSIIIPEGATLIGDSAFYYCYTLTSVTIPEGVTSIGNYAFSYCYALTSITIPEGVISIGNEAFSYCYALTSITIPEGVTSIGYQAFYYCYALTSITIPEGVTSIDNSMFYNCYALNSIIIPEGVTSIVYNAFYDCYALTSITIPEEVTSIGSSAFYDCYALTSITFEPTTPPTIESDAFESINPFCTIYVPAGTLEAYTTAENYPDPEIYNYVEYEL